MKKDYLSASERQKKYESSKQLLAKYALCIAAFNQNKDIKEAVPILDRIVSEIRDEGLGILLMFATPPFETFIDNCYKLHDANREISPDFAKSITPLYVLGYKPFFQHIPLYSKCFDFYRLKLKIAAQVNENSYLGGDTRRYDEHVALLCDFFRLKKEELSFGKGKNLNEFVRKNLWSGEGEAKMMVSRQLDVHEESMVTWVRRELETIQEQVWRHQNFQKMDLMCCKLHFEAASRVELVENIHQSFYTQQYFANDTDSLKKMALLETCREAVLKTIISFLNTEGGCLYLGFDGENKSGSVRGIPLSEAEKSTFLESFIKDVVIAKIYPPDDEKLEETKEEEDRRLDKIIKSLAYKYKEKCQNKVVIDSAVITKYVSLQFLNIYERDTLLYSRGTAGEDVRYNYIVKIMVKAGDPYEVYHFVNDKEVPEAYVREDRSNKKKTMYEFYDMVYDRLKKKANNHDMKQKTEAHSLCRFCLKAEDPKRSG